jgi:hypothetical protein
MLERSHDGGELGNTQQLIPANLLILFQSVVVDDNGVSPFPLDLPVTYELHSHLPSSKLQCVVLLHIDPPLHFPLGQNIGLQQYIILAVFPAVSLFYVEYLEWHFSEVPLNFRVEQLQLRRGEAGVVEGKDNIGCDLIEQHEGSGTIDDYLAIPPGPGKGYIVDLACSFILLHFYLFSLGDQLNDFVDLRIGRCPLERHLYQILHEDVTLFNCAVREFVALEIYLSASIPSCNQIIIDVVAIITLG